MRLALATLLAVLCTCWLVLGVARPPAVPPSGPTPERIQAWLGVDAGAIEAQGDVLALTRPDLPGCRVVLHDVRRAPADAPSTRNLAILLDTGTDTLDAGTGPACSRWYATVVERLRQQDVGLEPVRAGGDLPPRDAFATALLLLAAALAGAVPLLAVWAGRSLPAAVRRQALLVALLAFAVRALGPHRLTTVFFGYEYFAQAHYLDSVPRYGPGATALWALVLGPLAVDHAAALWLQSGVGALGVAAWAAWLSRACGSPRAGWLGAVVLGATPLFVRDHGSESMHVGALAALALAVLAVHEASRPCAAPAPGADTTGRRRWAVLAAATLAWSGLFRADVALLAVPTVAVLTWVTAGRTAPAPGWWRDRVVIATGAAAILTLSACLAFGAGRAQADLAAGNLPQWQGFLATLGPRLLADAVLWRPEWLPAALWLPVVAWAVLGRATPSRHHRWLLLVPLAVAWLLPYYADFNETSLARLQIPAATLLAVAAAALADQLVAASPRPRAWLAALGLAWLVTAAPTLSQVFARTNAHQEDDLLRAARAALPALAPYWLATRTYAEAADAAVHLHLPTYLFHPPGGHGRVVPAGEWLQARGEGRLPPGDAYFLRSLRCYARPAPAPGPSVEHPACAALATLPGTRPVFERDVPNLRDTPTFDYYGNSPTLRVGLYRLGAP